MRSVGRGRSLRVRTRDKDAATTIALLAATGAVLVLFAKLFLENRWTSLTCGDDRTLVLDRLQLACLACSTLAVIAGITALARRTRRPVWIIAAVLAAGMVATLVLVPDALGGYQCGITVA
jgi:uncharacterized membrane protein YbhN (UPF0104 family)